MLGITDFVYLKKTRKKLDKVPFFSYKSDFLEDLYSCHFEVVIMALWILWINSLLETFW
jgi:hypothetical protein